MFQLLQRAQLCCCLTLMMKVVHKTFGTFEETSQEHALFRTFAGPFKNPIIIAIICMIASVSQLHLSLSSCTNTQVKGDNLIRSEAESDGFSIPDVGLGGFPSTTWQQQITAILYKAVFIWLICWLNWFEHELVPVLCHEIVSKIGPD